MDNQVEIVKGELKSMFAAAGGVDSFSTSQAAVIIGKLNEISKAMNLTGSPAENFLAVCRKIFRIEVYNFPDITSGKYVFAANHVSEFDGPLFGTMHPNMLVVAKKAWTDDPHLNAYLAQLLNVVGVDRKDLSSGALGLVKCIRHIRGSANGTVMIFVQQTIADINQNRPEDIASGAFSIKKNTGAEIIPVFCEQVSFDYPTRIVFGEPMKTESPDTFGRDWLDAVLSMQNSLTPPARLPALNEKHSTPISQRDF